MEPALDTLARIRRVTGVSLDWLVASEPNGHRDIERAAARTSVADRVRWVRETLEPFMEAFALVMRVPAAEWRRYEAGDAEFPLETAKEFAHRCAVDLDYVYMGRLDGVAAALRTHLEREHPELCDVSNPPVASPNTSSQRATADGAAASNAEAHSNGTGRDFGSRARRARVRHPA